MRPKNWGVTKALCAGKSGPENLNVFASEGRFFSTRANYLRTIDIERCFTTILISYHQHHFVKQRPAKTQFAASSAGFVFVSKDLYFSIILLCYWSHSRSNSQKLEF